MEKKLYQIPTETDTTLSLQLSEVTGINSATGEERTYKELAILLETETGADGDGYQVTTLNKRGIEELIAKLTELKDKVTY